MAYLSMTYNQNVSLSNMRKLLTILITIFLVSCKDDNLNNSELRLKTGIYEGSFHYDTMQLWESFGITDFDFEEYASGGVMYQKYPNCALTKGTYTLTEGTISFRNIQIAQPPNGKISDHQNELLLIGDYTVESFSDSTISFWKNSSKGRQEYHLRLFCTK
jgi:hypothetical protein